MNDKPRLNRIRLSQIIFLVWIFATGFPADNGLSFAARAMPADSHLPRSSNYPEIAQLRADDAQDSDFFGQAVAISGNTMIVGAPGEDGGAGDPLEDIGAVYIFYQSETDPEEWTQITQLYPDTPNTLGEFGMMVAINGDTAVVSNFDYETAFVFERDLGGPDNWGRAATLNVNGGIDNYDFGRSVAIFGDIIAVGATLEDDDGAVHIFERNEGGEDNWGELTVLPAIEGDGFNDFGSAVALSGDTLVVGDPNEDGGPGDPINNAGAAYVFERNQGGPNNWGHSAILRASDAQESDWLGNSVAIYGDTVVVGAYSENGGPGDPSTGSGSAYVYERNLGGAENWGEAAILRASDGQEEDEFGYGVSISLDTIVVGARREDGGPGDPTSDSGAAYVFVRDEGGTDNWGEVSILRASDTQSSDRFGVSVTIDANTLAVGANLEDGGPGNPSSGSGTAYIFAQIQLDNFIYLPLVLKE